MGSMPQSRDSQTGKIEKVSSCDPPLPRRWADSFRQQSRWSKLVVLRAWRCFDKSDHLTTVVSFPDHFQVTFEFEHLAKSFAHDYVVFRQQDGNGFRSGFGLINKFKPSPVGVGAWCLEFGA